MKKKNLGKTLKLLFAQVFWALAAAATPAQASLLTVHIGPPAIGTGGSNPLSIPPTNPIEYEVSYVSASKFESNISLSPGLLFGYRAGDDRGLYFGMGGGLVISSNGTGPGVYSSVGYHIGESIKFNIEFKQALGYALSSAHLVSPYAIRAGISFEM